MTSASPHLKRLTNWVGFVVFAAWAVVTLSKMPAAGLMLAPTFLMELAVAISFLIRDEPVAATKSFRARFSAYAGSFMMVAFLELGRRFHAEWFEPQVNVVTPFAAFLWMAGSMWIVYSLWHLRRAFSIEPAARRLITSGPYSIARHPVYTGYFAQYVAMLMIFPSLALALVLLAWTVAMLDRMYLEERVLSSAFGEYVEYKHRVGALGPVLFRRTPRPRPVASV
jgi:protein-S-isoprenylcysteine O-methyltransferase Ste14